MPEESADGSARASEQLGRAPYVMTAVLIVGAAGIASGMVKYNISLIHVMPFSVLLVGVTVPVYLYWLSRGDSDE